MLLLPHTVTGAILTATAAADTAANTAANATTLHQMVCYDCLVGYTANLGINDYARS